MKKHLFPICNLVVILILSSYCFYLSEKIDKMGRKSFIYSTNISELDKSVSIKINELESEIDDIYNNFSIQKIINQQLLDLTDTSVTEYDDSAIIIDIAKLQSDVSDLESEHFYFERDINKYEGLQDELESLQYDIQSLQNDVSKNKKDISYLDDIMPVIEKKYSFDAGGYYWTIKGHNNSLATYRMF